MRKGVERQEHVSEWQLDEEREGKSGDVLSPRDLVGVGSRSLKLTGLGGEDHVLKGDVAYERGVIA